MNITLDFLKEKNISDTNLNFFQTDNLNNINDIINKILLSDNKEYIKYGNWLITRLFDKNQRVKYAYYAAAYVAYAAAAADANNYNNILKKILRYGLSLFEIKHKVKKEYNLKTINLRHYL
jgi:hypothetical protein